MKWTMIFLFIFVNHFCSSLALAKQTSIIPENKQSQLEYNIKQDIYRNYGLDVTNIRKMEFGIENEVYAIDTRRRDKYVIRIYSDRHASSISEEVELIKFLQKLPSVQSSIAHIVSGVDGKYQYQLNQKWYVLFNFVYGNHPKSFDSISIQKISYILKTIHNEGNKIKYKFKHRSIESVITNLDFFVYSSLQESLLSKQEYNYLKGILSSVRSSLSWPEMQFSTIIHYDAQPQNIIECKGKYTLIDFDDFIVANPIFELAVFIRGTCFSETGDFYPEVFNEVLRNCNSKNITTNFNIKKLLREIIIFDLIRVIQANIKKIDKSDKIKRKQIFIKFMNRMKIMENMEF